MSSPGEPDRTPSEAPPAAATPALERTGPYIADTTRPVESVAASAGRCRLLGEIARGGMGAVFKAYDPDLGRDLAVKVLLEQHRGRPELVRRFLEEARVGGRLQHPGVAPVHDVGRLADERPFFAMKLVEGRTLEQLLRQRKSPAEDLSRFLKVFEQVCQTLAYAHAQGIIHRDLKPLNIMVGAFGEVQVMDWGLSKVIGAADGVTATGESGAAPEATGAGQVLGTPSYMAPEQARGETDRLDERCDVFGLGAILCTILTGRPPYVRGDALEVLTRAGGGDLADGYARLDGCGADAELVGLAKGCLAAAACDRPADAGAVAAAVTAHLVGVQERLRAAELAKAAAEARAEASRAKAAAERRARRLTVGLAATVLLAACGVGAGALWYQHDQSIRAAEHAGKAAATERDVTAALEEAAALGKQAETLKADPTKWEAALVEAMSAVKRADGVLSSGVDDTGELRPRVDAMRAGLEAAQRDSRMIAGLETARYQEAEAGHEGGFDYAGAVALYASAFRQDDKDWDSPEPDKAAARINRRAIREDLLAGLDEWAFITPNPEESTRLRGIVQAADPDPGSLQNRFRALLHRKDWDGLRRLAFGPESKDVPTARLVHVGRELLRTGAVSEAVKFFKEANERRPGDFWIAFELAQASSEMKPPATDEAIRYYTAALMLRPNSVAVHINLGNALHDKHELDEAIAEFRKALQIQPDFARAHSNLGSALHDKHELDEAIAECRKALQIQPDFAEAHRNLGEALYDKHELDEAIAEYRKAIQFQQDDAHIHNSLGNALWDKGQLDEAITEFRKALQIQPDDAYAHHHLGLALYDKHQLDEAITEYRKALQFQPDDAHAHYNLGLALCDKHQLDEAIAEYRKAIQFQPEFAEAHNNLGAAVQAKGQSDEAIAEYRKAIQFQPDLAQTHNNLGAALRARGQWDEAITEYRNALQIQPNYANAHYNLGAALYDKHQLDEAITEYRNALQIQPDNADAHDNLGLALHDKGQLDEAITEYRKALQIQPDNADAHYNLGNALRAKGQLDEAITEFRKALQIQPDLAEAWCNFGFALRAQGRFAESMAALRRGHQFGSQKPNWSYPSAQWVRSAEDLAERDALLPALLRGEAAPADATQQVRFADFCQRYKRLYATAARFYADAFTAEPGLTENLQSAARYSAARAAALAACGRGEDAAKTDEKERSRWRTQARDWLRADLVLWTKGANGANPQGRAATAQALQHWKDDRDLTGVRDADALAKLPPDEQAAWHQLWADVDAMLTKVQPK